jgi:predicted Zn-dependent peptidase
MISLVLAMVSQVTLESSQLRKILPNNSNYFLEKRKSSYTSVQLILSSKGIPSSIDAPGYRHLIEHVVVRSKSGHDEELETKGALLRAATDRDWMRFEWRVPNEEIGMALEGVQSFLQFNTFEPEVLARESKIIGLESRDQHEVTLAVEDLWESFFGRSGIATMGDGHVLSKVKPDELGLLWKSLTLSQRVTISVCGDIDSKSVEERVRTILSNLPSGKTSSNAYNWDQRQLHLEIASNDDKIGVIPVGPINLKRTVASLVAGLGMSSKLRSPVFEYQPSMRGGIIVFYSKEMTPIKEQLRGEDRATLYELGKRFATGWVFAKQSSASDSATFNGILLSLDPALTPGKILEAVNFTSYSDVKRIIDSVVDAR